jgi:nucleotide-binding universal stress UspA family protein
MVSIGGVSLRILLAVDGSACSDRATDLVSTLALPADSLIRVIAAQQPHADVLSLAWANGVDPGIDADTTDQLDVRHMREAVERAERMVRRPGINVEGYLLRGRAASAIVDEASGMEADLIVVGSRGHGTIATMLLGSTAAEVVDHAPCPVLVARNATLGPLAFADDGSRSARCAETLLAEWPIFSGEHVSVVTVAETAVPVAAAFTPGLYDQVLDSYTRSVDEARDSVRDEASTSASHLAIAGMITDPVILEGDPASELVRFAAERRTATIVMGTRGHTGLARLLLGSVARNVLIHAPCSVLVTRERD